MSTEVLTVAFSVIKFILDRVNASNATKAAFLALVTSTMNDGLISKETHNVFSDQYHDIENSLPKT